VTYVARSRSKTPDSRAAFASLQAARCRRSMTSSQRVLSKATQGADFEFNYSEIERVLCNLLA